MHSLPIHSHKKRLSIPKSRTQADNKVWETESDIKNYFEKLRKKTKR